MGVHDEATATSTIDSDHDGVAGSIIAADAALLAARRYQVLAEVARGGVGRIVRARDLAFDRTVAIKEPLDPAGGGPRLRAEAAILALLQHPSIVPVYDIGTRDDGVPFFAMKLVEGRSLQEAIRAATSLEQRLALIPQVVAVAEAVAYAHSHAVIHRDLKPANILLGRFGETIVIDWGLAKVLDGEATTVDQRGGAKPERPAVASATLTGEVMGTPAYMAPEQARGEPVDTRADVYALGAVLYHVLAGTAPFAGQRGHEVIAAVSATSPEPIESIQPRAPADLVAIVTKAMARSAADRYPSAAQLAEDLLRFQTGRLVAARRYSLIARARRWVRGHRGIFAATILAAASALVAILVMSSAPPPGAQCAQAGDATAMWNPTRAAAMRATFLASKRPYAADTADRVAARLDSYTHDWSAARIEACRATHARGEQSEALLDLRMACLDRLRLEAGSLVDVFAKEPNPKVVDEAVQATTRLSPLAACADVDALQAVIPPPTNPVARAEVTRLGAKLAEVQALQKTGQYRAGLVLAKSLVGDAEHAGHPPTLAAILAARASLEAKTGDAAASEATIQLAMSAAADARDDRLAAELWAELVYVVGNLRTRPDDALRMRPAAELALRRAHGPPESSARLLASLGTALARAGKPAEAKPLMERAIDLREHAAKADPIGVATALSNLAALFTDQGKFGEGMIAQKRALAIYEQELGPDHPLVGIALSNLGHMARLLGRYPEARGYLERALAARERNLGPDHPDTASTLHNLGIVARFEGKDDEAQHHYERALAIRLKRLGPDHRDLAETYTSLGSLLRDRGKYDEAKLHLERAIAIYEKSGNTDHPFLHYPLSHLGKLFQREGKYEASKRMYERALAVTEKAYGPDHPDVAFLLVGLSEAHLALGSAEQARALAERSLKIREAIETPPAEPAASRFMLAQALWKLGRDLPRARTLAATARDGYAKAGPRSTKELAEVTAWIDAHR